MLRGNVSVIDRPLTARHRGQFEPRITRLVSDSAVLEAAEDLYAEAIAALARKGQRQPELRFIGDSFHPLLQRQNIVVTGHNRDGFVPAWDGELWAAAGTASRGCAASDLD
jgi:hypothetical protein